MICSDPETTGLSMKVINHVIDATLYQAHKELHLDAEPIKRRIAAINLKDKVESSTLWTLKSIVFSNLGLCGISAALHFVKKALEVVKDNAVLHFIYAKNLRRLRRRNSIWQVGPEERDGFEKAYKLSNKPVFAIRMIQCYKESQQRDKCKAMLKTFLRSKPQSCDLQLKLALISMSMADLENAKKCLDFVERQHPGNCTFKHYKGLYLEKKGFTMVRRVDSFDS